MASGPKSFGRRLRRPRVGSSMNRTPSSAERTTRSVLRAVAPTCCPTSAARSTSTRWPFCSRPTARYISASSRATVVLPVPGLPRKTRCWDVAASGRPCSLRRPAPAGRHQRLHLLLDRLQADQRVQVGLDRRQRPGRCGPAAEQVTDQLVHAPATGPRQLLTQADRRSRGARPTACGTTSTERRRGARNRAVAVPRRPTCSGVPAATTCPPASRPRGRGRAPSRPSATTSMSCSTRTTVWRRRPAAAAGHQHLDVGRVQPGGRLVEQVERVPAAGALQLAGQLDPLRLPAGQLGRRLAQPQVAEATSCSVRRLRAAAGTSGEEHLRRLHGQVEHLGDGLPGQGDLEGLGAVPGRAVGQVGQGA